MSPRVKEPDLRAVRRALLAVLDRLPPSGPAWHPAYLLAGQVRGKVQEAMEILTKGLEP
jgi:hypothetical protein